MTYLSSKFQSEIRLCTDFWDPPILQSGSKTFWKEHPSLFQIHQMVVRVLMKSTKVCRMASAHSRNPPVLKRQPAHCPTAGLQHSCMSFRQSEGASTVSVRELPSFTLLNSDYLAGNSFAKTSLHTLCAFLKSFSRFPQSSSDFQRAVTTSYYKVNFGCS